MGTKLCAKLRKKGLVPVKVSIDKDALRVLVREILKEDMEAFEKVIEIKVRRALALLPISSEEDIEKSN